MENLLNEYMIDEDSFTQEPIDEKYLDSEDEAPDFIYLQEQLDDEY